MLLRGIRALFARMTIYGVGKLVKKPTPGSGIRTPDLSVAKRTRTALGRRGVRS
jgi:hypothetical protein